MLFDSPLVVHVPHASRYIPEDMRRDFLCLDLDRELLLMTDLYCDELFDTEAERILFPVSRLVCDPERFRDPEEEIMEKVGMGAVYTRCSGGLPLRDIDALDREKILRRYYDPHHQRLTEAVRRRLLSWERCLIIDGHSFSPEPLSHESDQTTPRPDICIGTDSFHTSPRLAERAMTFFRRSGYECCLNRPFAGTIVPGAYYRRDPRVASLMIEINRKLYMNADGERNAEFQKTVEVIGAFLDMMKEEC